MSSQDPSMEERILRAVRTTLVDVIKDTTTSPGLRHPLSQSTREEIRHCLDLITARQIELAEAAGTPLKERPVYADEPRRSVAVPLEPRQPREGSDPAED